MGKLKGLIQELIDIRVMINSEPEEAASMLDHQIRILKQGEVERKEYTPDKRKVNITFQVIQNQERWEEAPIVYLLENVDVDTPISDIAEAISAVTGYKTVRTARLFLNDPITPKQACRYNGGYHSLAYHHTSKLKLPINNK
jgi:hypothetical protein